MELGTQIYTAWWEKLEKYIGGSVWPKNKIEGQGGNFVQDFSKNCKTINDVRRRDIGSKESTREEVACGGNEDF